MAITIDDIYDKEFALKGGGYDRDDVDQFLDEICDEMTNMQEKITSLESDLQKAQDELKAAREAVKPAPVAQAQPVETPIAKTSSTLESATSWAYFPCRLDNSRSDEWSGRCYSSIPASRTCRRPRQGCPPWDRGRLR